MERLFKGKVLSAMAEFEGLDKLQQLLQIMLEMVEDRKEVMPNKDYHFSVIYDNYSNKIFNQRYGKTLDVMIE